MNILDNLSGPRKVQRDIQERLCEERDSYYNDITIINQAKEIQESHYHPKTGKDKEWIIP